MAYLYSQYFRPHRWRATTKNMKCRRKWNKYMNIFRFQQYFVTSLTKLIEFFFCFFFWRWNKRTNFIRFKLKSLLVQNGNKTWLFICFLVFFRIENDMQIRWAMKFPRVNVKTRCSLTTYFSLWFIFQLDFGVGYSFFLLSRFYPAFKSTFVCWH